MKILNMPPPSDGMATMDNNGTFEQGTDELPEKDCASLLLTSVYLYHIAGNRTEQPGVSKVKAELSQTIVASLPIGHRIQIFLAHGTKKGCSSENMEHHLFTSSFSLLSCLLR